MQQGENVYERISGYGTYGRHNREYTVAELRTFLADCSYEVESLFAADIGNSPSLPPLGADVNPAHRGENLFCVARAIGDEAWAYPEWLYSSRHALQRIVRPDVVVGLNCDLQTRGLHEREMFRDRPARWTGPDDAEIVLAPTASGAGWLEVEGEGIGFAAAGPVRLVVEMDGSTHSFEVLPNGETFLFEIPCEVRAGKQTVRLRTDRTWIPAEVNFGGDVRRLGVVLRAVGFQVSGRPPLG
jgi:hypothetical protein